MILMDVKLDNLCSFKDFHCNFSYPRKVKRNSIEGEYLKNSPQFRYKKVNILMGPNASGKTSLGKVLTAIYNFVFAKNPTLLLDLISNPSKKTSFQIEIVNENKNDEYLFIRAHVEIPKNCKTTEELLDHCKGYIVSTTVNPDDTYEKCVERIDELNPKIEKGFLNTFNDDVKYGWYFTFQESENRALTTTRQTKLYMKCLKNILCTLDPSIRDVRQADSGVKDTIVIDIPDNPLVISLKDDRSIGNSFLSSGTKSGVTLAALIANIIEHNNGFYYCDERFAYVQSDVEKALLSIMISSLNDCEQLFFTTHNTDILDINLPKHSYIFLRKDVDNSQKIEAITASDIINKPDQNLRNAVENDVFRTVPSDEKIYELLEA